MIVYLDILLIENFFVNLFLLTITTQTIKIKVPIKREILGAILGSGYVLVIVFPYLNIFTKVPFKLVVAFMMIYITLGRKSDLTSKVKGTILFILYSMLLAGLCFYLAISKSEGPIPSAMLYNFSYKKLLLSIMIIYIVIYRVAIYIKDRKILMTYIYATDIYIDNIKTTVNALLDTGNELREPVTNLPVMIVEREAFKTLKMGEHSTYSIPYSVVGGYNSKLMAIKPDSVQINIKGNLQEKGVILAFSDKKLSKHNEYNGLLPRGIIE